jgi:hypothetical protein
VKIDEATYCQHILVSQFLFHNTHTANVALCLHIFQARCWASRLTLNGIACLHHNWDAWNCENWQASMASSFSRENSVSMLTRNSTQQHLQASILHVSSRPASMTPTEELLAICDSLQPNSLHLGLQGLLAVDLMHAQHRSTPSHTCRYK